MAISSIGVGSGLDVESIVSKIGSIERQPLTKLKTQYKSTEERISTYGKIKSLVDSLNSAARKLSLDSGWNGVKISSSSSGVVGTSSGITPPGSYNVKVDNLAQSQTSASVKFDKSNTMGAAGVIRFTIGHQSPKSFDLNILGGDSLENVVSKINDHAEISQSISASIITDGEGRQQMMLRSRGTGLDNKFSVDFGASVAGDGSLTALSAAQANTGFAKLSGAQTAQSVAVTTGANITGGGTITLNLGGGQTRMLQLDAGDDTLQKVADRINDPNSNLSKTVEARIVVEGGQERLSLRLRSDASQPSVTISVNSTDVSLQSLNNQTVSNNVSTVQQARNAQISLNGVTVESNNNTFTNVIPGMTISVSKQGEEALLTAQQDQDGIKENITKFVEAYNTLNDMLTEATKYDPEKKVAGLLQGDSAAISLQNSLRMMTQAAVDNASGVFKQLSQVGITWVRNGAQATGAGQLVVNQDKLTQALKDVDAVKSLFAAKPDALGRGGGIASNFKTLTDELVSWNGSINKKLDGLENLNKRNIEQQTRVEERATRAEKRLRTQYTALDTKMASIKGLSSYVEQMVAAWNKKS